EPLARLLGLGGDDVTWLPGHPAATAPLYAAWHATQLGLPVRFAGEPHADATVVHAPPTLVPRLLRARQAGELPALRLVVTAGDRVPAALTGWCADAGVRLVSYYGAAELSFVAVRDDDRPGYRAFPGVELDVRDGLLWSRSPYQAHGYLDTPEGTAALRRAPGGWASVGDAARWVPPSGGIDAGGRRVEILGRADQAITVSGHTVLAEDVEHALAGLPGVAELVVVGVPDRVHGARIVALWAGDPSASSPDAALARAAD
ncbi:AMP-binding protein, partial [Piscicoccus intestinalis]|uniref:AMP-binding protein n=1 Tax=Piscicoccus intestinalis TaxID=746033 RepID=UPI000A6F2321